MTSERGRAHPYPVEVRDRLDRACDRLAVVALALAAVEIRESICPDEARGLALVVEDILRSLQEETQCTQ